MESEYRCRILLLDFGHPMNNNTINNIINSLENVLALKLTFQLDTNKINFGILILDSEYQMFHSEFNLQNYDLIIQNLRAASKMVNRKVTIQEYKYLLLNSIEIVRCGLPWKKIGSNKLKTRHFLIQFFIVTKKSASILINIVNHVSNKLQKNISDAALVQSFKIVQILSDHQRNLNRDSVKNTSINWIFCSDNKNDLTYFFKGCLLNPQQEVRILLSNDQKLEIKCEVFDCVVNSVSLILGSKFDLLNATQFKSLDPSLDVKMVKSLEITNRLQISGICPTLVFGIPRRLYAIPSSSLSGTGLQVNSKIFKELCQTLNRTGQGLLAKSVLRIGSSELISFYLLTSDGDILLMNDIAPDELYLPKRMGHDSIDSSDEESTASVIKSCFQKIQFLDEYNPENFSSKVYEYLKNNFVQFGQFKGFVGHFGPNVEFFRKTKRKNENLEKSNTTTDLTNNNEGNTIMEKENKKKKLKQISDKHLQNIHPALLSPNIVQKYRKVPSNAFKLSELSKEYNENVL